MDKADKDKVDQLVSLIDLVIGDTSIPKNIRKAMSDAKEKLLTEEDLTVSASSAIYILNEVSEDINMPMHARTQLWTILSALETVKS